MDADDGTVDPTQPSPDPAISYPRGNRLGLRHPRPTVVIAVAVVLLLGGAFLWQALQPRQPLFCTVAGAIATPTAATPQAAFDVWWDAGGAASAQQLMAQGLDGSVEVPSRDDFEPQGEDVWMWRIDDAGVEVGVGPAEGTTGYRVIGVNRCGGRS